MDRTAEEFVHQLPNGRWFVGDFVARRGDQDVFLIERELTRLAEEIAMDAVPSAGIPTCSRKSGAQRAAQKMIERVLDSNAFLAPRPGQ